MSDQKRPTYSGVSQAIHVESDRVSESFDPPDPILAKPHYHGRSEAIYNDPLSPSLDETEMGNKFTKPHYHGASQAIHVRGPRTDLPTPSPIETCDCTSVGVDGLRDGNLSGGSAGTGTGGSAVGPTDWSTQPAFGDRPLSGTIYKNGEHGFVIDGLTFKDQMGHGVISIHLENCYDFQIINVDFDSCTEPMLFVHCHDFEVGFWRARNIIGPSVRDGSNRGNAIQMGYCIRYDIHDFEVAGGDTEDVISNFQSGGRSAAEPSRIYNFLIDMTGYISDSGTGVILGDAQVGSWVEVFNFAMIRPGQVAVAIVGGIGHKVHDGIIYSDAVPHSNVAIGEAFDSPDVEVWNMQVQWRAAGGASNPTFWGSGTHYEHDNDWDAPITAADITAASIPSSGIALPAPTVTRDFSDVFESFDGRTTVSPDFGSTSRDGIPWTAETGTVFVENGHAVLRCPYGTSQFAQSSARLTGGPFVGGGDWVAYIKFKFPTRPTPNEINTITHEPGLVVENIVISGTGFEYPLTQMSAYSPTLIPGQWYRVKFGWFPSEHMYRVKNVWLDGDAEPPTWLHETAVSPSFDMITSNWTVKIEAAQVGVPNQAVDAELWIDWIDDGDGPNVDCVETIGEDDFLRVGSGPSFGNSEFVGSPAWHKSIASSGAVISTDGAVASVVQSSPPAFSGEGSITRSENYVSLPMSIPIDCAIKFRWTALVGTRVIQDAFLIGQKTPDQPPANVQGIQVTLQYQIAPPGGQPFMEIADVIVNYGGGINTGGTFRPFGLADPGIGTWIWYRILVDVGGKVWMKLWLDGSTEPDWIDNPSNSLLTQRTYSRPLHLLTAMTVLDVEVNESFHAAVGPSHHAMEIDRIIFTEPCEEAPPPETCEPCSDAPAAIGAGYLPIFRRQIGDPTTNLDGFICVMESAAMALDWHTRGGVQVWGGELIPFCGRTEAQIVAAPGTTLQNAQQAWQHYGQNLEIWSGRTFDQLLNALAEGRAVVLIGDYGELSLAERCQDDFEDNHAIVVLPYASGGMWAVGDPLCGKFTALAESTLRRYANAYTGNSTASFAVTRAWTV